MNKPEYGFWLPPDISTHGAAIDNLIWIVHIFMAVLAVGWGVFFFYSLWRFRARAGHAATYELKPFKASKMIEIAIFGLEIVLLVGLAMPLWAAAKNPPPEGDSIVVRVIAQQFAWNIHYPGADKSFGRTNPSLVADDNAIGLDTKDPAADDDVVTINELNVPVNEKVLVKLTSKDVIHSFGIPVLRVKHDAIPGMLAPIWFEATQTGSFDIACAQLCGNNHYRMRGAINVQSRADYETWMQQKMSEQHPEAAPAPLENPAAPITSEVTP